MSARHAPRRGASGRRCRTGAEAAPLPPLPGLRTFSCSWCSGTTGELPADTRWNDRVCDACIDARLNTR